MKKAILFLLSICIALGFCGCSFSKEYTITYDYDGGVVSVANPTSYLKETGAKLQIPTKDYYVFAGYRIDGTETIILDTIPVNTTGDLKLIATYIYTGKISYTITYDYAGGIIEGENIATYTAEDGATIKTPTKEYYDFAGYKINGTENIILDTIPVNTTGNLNLVATYVLSEDTLIIDFMFKDSKNRTSTINGKTEADSVFIRIGESLGEELPTNVIPDNTEEYKFGGWYVKNGDVFTAKKVTGDTVFDSEFISTITIGEDKIITLYARMANLYIGPY